MFDYMKGSRKAKVREGLGLIGGDGKQRPLGEGLFRHLTI